MLDERPIHRSVSQVMLFAGADRWLVMISALACGYCAFALITPPSLTRILVVGFCTSVAWVVMFAALRRMARADPLMRRVYLRHILRYRAFYPAKAGLCSRGGNRLSEDWQ